MTDSNPREVEGERPTVLMVDDEEAFAGSAALWLDGDYEVRVATDGEEAIEQYVSDVDAVLLDRRMPGRSGDEVLDRLDDTPGDAGIAIVSAVAPDHDVIEMPLDSYLRKPVARDDIQETTEKLVRRANFASCSRWWTPSRTGRALPAPRTRERRASRGAGGRTRVGGCDGDGGHLHALRGRPRALPGRARRDASPPLILRTSPARAGRRRAWRRRRRSRSRAATRRPRAPGPRSRSRSRSGGGS